MALSVAIRPNFAAFDSVILTTGDHTRIGGRRLNRTGWSFRYRHVDFARCIVNSGCSTFRRIAGGAKLTAESTCLCGCALPSIEIHEIPAGTDRLVSPGCP